MALVSEGTEYIDLRSENSENIALAAEGLENMALISLTQAWMKSPCIRMSGIIGEYQ